MSEDEWGAVLQGRSELYPNERRYADQLQALEKAVEEDSKNPALRFLAGLHFGYTGRTTEALREIDKLAELAPQDKLARKLRDRIAENVPQKVSALPE